MSSVTRKPRKLERWRAKPQRKNPVEIQGKGAAQAREGKAIAIRDVLSHKKEDGKLVRELNTLGVEDLKQKLQETRKELFDLRFKHATSQLENVAGLKNAKRRIARILTLIKQKEVGA